jgi:hypothetical protein
MTSDRVCRACGWLCLAVAVLLAGCATPAPGGGEREYLDAQTAATVTVGVPALVFARERPDLAVHARDYLTLVPVDVNRAGVHAQYFFGYAWSTIDKRSLADEQEMSLRFELVADGRRILLVQHPGSLRELGLGESPVPPPARSATLLVAPASREQQDFVLSAADVRAVLVRDQGSLRYELWSR